MGALNAFALIRNLPVSNQLGSDRLPVVGCRDATNAFGSAMIDPVVGMVCPFAVLMRETMSKASVNRINRRGIVARQTESWEMAESKTLIGVALSGLAMMAFGWWGLETTLGRYMFDEMAGAIPFVVGAVGGFVVAACVFLTLLRIMAVKRRK